MKDSIQRLLWGIVFIVIGGLWVASNFIPGFALDFSVLWPMFLLIPGLSLWLMYLTSSDKKVKAGLMIPANILVLLAVTFWVNIFLSPYLDQIWLITSFMYTGAVAISFWLAWLASGRAVAFMIPAVILTFITLIIFLASGATVLLTDSEQFSSFVLPFMLIAIGVFVISGPVWWGVSGGEDIADKMEKWGEDFGERMEKMGEDIEKGFEKGLNNKTKDAEDFKSEPVEPKDSASN